MFKKALTASLTALLLVAGGTSVFANSYVALNDYNYSVATGAQEIAYSPTFHMDQGTAFLKIKKQYCEVEGYKSNVEYTLYKVDASGNRTYVSRAVQIGRVDTTAPVEYNFGSVPAGNYVVEIDNDTVSNPLITGIIRVYEEYY